MRDFIVAVLIGLAVVAVVVVGVSALVLGVVLAVVAPFLW